MIHSAIPERQAVSSGALDRLQCCQYVELKWFGAIGGIIGFSGKWKEVCAFLRMNAWGMRRTSATVPEKSRMDSKGVYTLR